MKTPSREWQATVLEAASPLTEQAAKLSSGGFLTINAAPTVLEAWAASAAKAAGRRLLSLDLEGWEPELSTLETFVRYRDGVQGVETSDLPGTAGGTADEDDEPALLGLFAAAGVCLFGATSPVTDRQSFIDRLVQEGADAPILVLVADGETTPEPLRRALRVASEAGSVAVLEGLRGESSGGRIEPSVEPTDERLEAVTDVNARRVLEALAILERPFPLEPLLELLVQDRSLHEDVIDLVDDVLVDELELLEDLGFIHPLFEQSLYRLNDPLFAARLLAGVDVRPRAEALLSFLRQRLEPRARSTSMALLRLADLAGLDEQARRLALRLRWWAPADELKVDLEAALDADEITDVNLLTLGGDGVLAPDIRIALLDMHEAADAPPETAGRQRLYRARALRDAGQVTEALEAVADSLDWHRVHRDRLGSEQVELFLETQLTAARLLVSAGEARPARDQLQQARELASQVLENEDPRHAVLAAEHGRVLMHVGELRAAREPLEEAYRRTLARFGEAHPQVVSARNNLAALLIDIGELELAQSHLVGALQAARRSGLPLPFRLNLWGNLQSAAARLGGNPAIDQLIQGVHGQLEGGAFSSGPFAPLAEQVPTAALAELGQMLGLDAGLELGAFEAIEDRLLETLAEGLGEPPEEAE